MAVSINKILPEKHINIKDCVLSISIPTQLGLMNSVLRTLTNNNGLLVFFFSFQIKSEQQTNFGKRIKKEKKKMVRKANSFSVEM